MNVARTRAPAGAAVRRGGRTHARAASSRAAALVTRSRAPTWTETRPPARGRGGQAARTRWPVPRERCSANQARRARRPCLRSLNAHAMSSALDRLARRARALEARTAGPRSAARTGTRRSPRGRSRRRRGSRGGRGWSPAGSTESLTCSEPSRSSPTTRSKSSSTAARRLRGADVVAARRAGGRSPGRRRAACRRRASSISRASSSNERPSVPPAPAVSSRCSAQSSDSFSASRDHLGGALERRVRRRRRPSAPSPGAAPRRRAPERRAGAAATSVSDVSDFSRISASSEAQLSR